MRCTKARLPPWLSLLPLAWVIPRASLALPISSEWLLRMVNPVKRALSPLAWLLWRARTTRRAASARPATRRLPIAAAPRAHPTPGTPKWRRRRPRGARLPPRRGVRLPRRLTRLAARAPRLQVSAPHAGRPSKAPHVHPPALSASSEQRKFARSQQQFACAHQVLHSALAYPSKGRDLRGVLW